MSNSCTLDKLLPDDLPELLRLFIDPEAREFLGGPLDEESASKRGRNWIDCSSSSPIWAIRQNRDKSFLGYVLLDVHHNGVDMEISYALLPENWGSGYATNALLEAFARASRDFGLEELVAETQARNQRSVALLERVGMIEESRLRRFGEEQLIYRIGLPCGVP